MFSRPRNKESLRDSWIGFRAWLYSWLSSQGCRSDGSE
jgi:hypothetical protein